MIDGRRWSRTSQGVTLYELAVRCISRFACLPQWAIQDSNLCSRLGRRFYRPLQLPLCQSPILDRKDSNLQLTYPKYVVQPLHCCRMIPKRWRQELNLLRPKPRLFSGQCLPVEHPTTMSITKNVSSGNEESLLSRLWRREMI
jgi:hypothetical protein